VPAHRQPLTAQTHNRKKLVWVRGVVCRSTQTQSSTVVACVYCSAYHVFIHECRRMSDGVFIQFECQLFKSYGNPDGGLPDDCLYGLCK
jgi:DNA replicative helicase MCM subunit Mcm2 (Cdc46/Mcm family)